MGSLTAYANVLRAYCVKRAARFTGCGDAHRLCMPLATGSRFLSPLLAADVFSLPSRHFSVLYGMGGAAWLKRRLALFRRAFVYTWFDSLYPCMDGTNAVSVPGFALQYGKAADTCT